MLLKLTPGALPYSHAGAMCSLLNQISLADCCLTDFSFYAEVEEGEKTIAETAAALVFGNVTNGTDVVTAIEAPGSQF